MKVNFKYICFIGMSSISAGFGSDNQKIGYSDTEENEEAFLSYEIHKIEEKHDENEILKKRIQAFPKKENLPVTRCNDLMKNFKSKNKINNNENSNEINNKNNKIINLETCNKFELKKIEGDDIGKILKKETVNIIDIDSFKEDNSSYNSEDNDY